MLNGFLKQSTASQTRLVGPFIDDTDFKTLETGLTIANTDVKLSANGGTSANKNSGGGTHIVNGKYALTFDATDTATVGELDYSIAVSGALVVTGKFMVLEEAIYDALFGSSAAGFNASGQVTVGSFAAGAITAAAIATNAIDADALAADAGTEIAAAVLAAGDIDGFSLEEFGKLALAALVGKLSGAATTTVTIRSADDTVDRIVATVDADGNRSAVTLTETG